MGILASKGFRTTSRSRAFQFTVTGLSDISNERNFCSSLIPSSPNAGGGPAAYIRPRKTVLPREICVAEYSSYFFISLLRAPRGSLLPDRNPMPRFPPSSAARPTSCCIQTRFVQSLIANPVQRLRCREIRSFHGDPSVRGSRSIRSQISRSLHGWLRGAILSRLFDPLNFSPCRGSPLFRGVFGVGKQVIVRGSAFTT